MPKVNMDDADPEVRRVSIVLSEHAIMLMTLFKKRHDNLDDLWAWDWLSEEIHTGYKKSSQQVIDAMEGHWCPAFLMALRDRITETLAEHDKRFGTAFAAKFAVDEQLVEKK